MARIGVEGAAIGVFSRGIARIRHLAAFLGHPVVVMPRGRTPRILAAAGWGRQRSGERAERYSATHGIPCWRLEDGFLRSVGLGVDGTPPWSLIVDDIGIYFDGTRPSRLEDLLNRAEFPPALLARAGRLRDALLADHLSKYNHAPDAHPDCLPDHGRSRVLLVDQTANDQSIRYGLADSSRFRAMLDAAIAENPGAEMMIKTHPDVIAGKRPSAMAFARHRAGLTWFAQDVSPLSLLRRVDRVYTVSSQMGLEALLLGKPVACFGLPFYAGWGLTDDRVGCARRVRRRNLLELVAATYLLYPRYVDPTTGERCEAEQIVERLALQRRRFAETAGRIEALGIGYWKRAYVRPFVAAPWGTVRFGRSRQLIRRRDLSDESRLLVWSSRETPTLRILARASGLPIWRMEDGFVRSVGLGSDFVRPWSLVIDKRGIYFDPSTESDLEDLLNRTRFTPELLRRATKVRSLICDQRITKYNVESDQPLRLETGRRPVILVPGQVENDASVVLGGGTIRTNEELLRTVRRQNPEAYLLFKPHPDVLAGNRRGFGQRAIWQALCDHVETRHSIIRCIEAAHEVHTMTSLSGFDALLRGRRVVTYGTPFYAGWGLTEDLAPIARRQRRLSLDELVAGALLLYPRYWDPDACCHVELEDILRKIIDRKALRQPPSVFPFVRWRKWLTYLQAIWLSSSRR